MSLSLLRSLAPLLACVSVAAFSSARTAASALTVAEFGARPDDGQCDTQAIQAAIAAAQRSGATELRFAAGTYSLIKPFTKDYYLGVIDVKDLALLGAVDAKGNPATRLERTFTLTNDTTLPTQLSVLRSSHVTFKNFILANNPPLGSTARVIAVDLAKDEVVVEVLPGLPAYDGMRCASAHVWAQDTGELKRFGTTPGDATLTIGLAITAFWKAVPGGTARQLSMTGAGFAAKVAVGDHISWHHKSTDMPNQTLVRNSRDLVFENILIPNVSNMGMGASFNRNLTFRRVRFEPENGNLAIGGRDGMHLSMNSGELLVEDCVFMGLRMDPLVIKRNFGIVKEVRRDGSLAISPGYEVPAGDSLRFWVGTDPVDRAVTNFRREKDLVVYHLAGGAPAATVPGTAVSFLTYSLTRGVIRNTRFAQNFGSAIVNFEENITVEGCTFDSNAYQVKYGPNPISGGFVRNNIVRNNVFLNTSWIDIARRGQPASLVIHSMSQFFVEPRYNRNILITGNVFKNPHRQSGAVAVDVRNAEDVVLRDNVYEGFDRDVAVDGKTPPAKSLR
ncbi:MAG: right-handed parallel beta-helix repeat-containing protein [Opitutaceae bacterium]